MNVVGIGTDVVCINRFQNAVEKWGDHFLQRIFTQNELAYAGGKKAYYVHMAGKFSAKEAVKKALPEGIRIGLNWCDIEILNSDDGKPHVVLHGQAKKLEQEFNLSKVFVSISHTENIATANSMAVTDGS